MHVIVHDTVLLRGGEEYFRNLISLCEFSIRRIVGGKKGFHPENLKAVHRVVAVVPGLAGKIRKGTVENVVFPLFRYKTAAAGKQVDMRFFLSLPGIDDILQRAGVIDERSFGFYRVVVLVKLIPLLVRIGNTVDDNHGPVAIGHGAETALISLRGRESGAAAGPGGNPLHREDVLVRQRFRRSPGCSVRHLFTGVFGTHVFHQRDGAVRPVTAVRDSVAVQQYAERQDHHDRKEHDQKREQRRPAPFPQNRQDPVANKHFVPS